MKSCIHSLRNYSLHKLLLPLFALAAFAPAASAGDVIKANNQTALSANGSWSLSVVPGSGDVAVWDSTVSTPNNATLLGADLSWQGIRVTNPAGSVNIGPFGGTGNTLTLGAAGVDTSAFTGAFYLYAPLVLGSSQTWNIGSGTTYIGNAGTVATLNTAGNTLTINNGTVTVNDSISGSGGLTKTGAGTLTLRGNNTYTGTTTVNGTVQIGSGVSGSLSSSSNITSTNGGNLWLGRSDSVTLANTISGNVIVSQANTGTTTITGNNTYTGVTAILTGALSVSSINSITTSVPLGTVHSATSSLGSPINNYTSGNIQLGQFASTGQLTYTGTGETTDRWIYLGGRTGGGILDQSGTGVLKFISNIYAPGSTGVDERKTLTLQGSGTGTGEFSGAIVDSTAGTAGQLATSLTKAGSGTWTLSGNNTYTGATLVSSGTLVLSGSGSINSSAVTVNGGTLRNNSSTAYTGALTFTSGTVGGTNLNGSLGGLTIGTGQTLSPGNSPGNATTTSQTWAGGGTYVWEINNATGTAGVDPGWDLLSGTAALTISATSDSKFNIAITSLNPTTNIAGDATNFYGLTTNYQWKIADFASAITLDPTAFSLNTSAFSNAVQVGSTWAIVLGNAPGITGGDNTQLWVTYTIPEPSTWALLAFSLTTVMVLRRRRNS